MEKILNNPEFKEHMARLAVNLGRDKDEVMKDAEVCLKELFATHNPVTETVAAQASQFVVSRGFDKKVDVRKDELEKVRQLTKQYATAFVLTHKTYLDTFVLNVVLAKHKIKMPYTFGGINMSFLGAGQIGRQAGTIFIRRSFKDDEIYKAVLRTYISTLVSEKAGFMWAIEGTRSRTGKLLWPRLGILKYIVDGAAHTNSDNVRYIPVSIVYDTIPDVKAMTEEKTGSEKKAESLTWFLGYIRKMMTGNFGRITVRFGDPISILDTPAAPEIEEFRLSYSAEQIKLQKLAFELVYRISHATPVTTTSLVCTTLLSKFSATKQEIESDVANLMSIAESHKEGVVIERTKAVGQSVQKALNLLLQSEVIKRQGSGLDAKYAIEPDAYLQAVYYSNMSIHQFINHAFIELAFMRVADKEPEKRMLAFWAEIMRLRDIFKFEFFYSRKPIFSDEIEAECRLIDPDWQEKLTGSREDVIGMLKNQQLLVAQGILYPYVEAYRVVGFAADQRDPNSAFDRNQFLQTCIAMGEELNWQGRIQRAEAVTRPFLINGVYLAENRGLIATDGEDVHAAINKYLYQLNDIVERLLKLQDLTLARDRSALSSTTALAVTGEDAYPNVVKEVMEGPSGPKIGAFFDLDRTLIGGFSAKEFFTERIKRRQMSTREVAAQFAGGLVYAIGNRNFASLAAVSAKGVKGTPESSFIEVGEEVFLKHLAKEIYPESRALVEAHFKKGHTVAIVSAATRYQVTPVARDLNIQHIMCTEMEVENGKFTGNIIEPPCWGDGKAHAARVLADQFDLELSECYFYTDSHEDMPLMEIVGRPRPINPDERLTEVAKANDWPIQTFKEPDGAGVTGLARTGMAFSSMVPALAAGLSTTLFSGSRRKGVNAMTATLGDLGTTLGGIKLNVEGEENMWKSRPAVFIFNHQSSADLLIGAKLLRKDATAIAKQELKFSIAGPLLMAGGVVFINRGNKKKAIEALEPAVEALRNGTSVAIAPEGTRSKDHHLGSFKKGAFHMAMQAGVPVVPMVILNAHDALPKGSIGIKASTIDVKVLEPIPTDDWTVEDLEQRIAGVRQLFLTELGQTDDAPALGDGQA